MVLASRPDLVVDQAGPSRSCHLPEWLAASRPGDRPNRLDECAVTRRNGALLAWSVHASSRVSGVSLRRRRGRGAPCRAGRAP